MDKLKVVIPDAVTDRDEQRRKALGKVYALLLRLNAEKEAADGERVSQAQTPSAADAPAHEPETPDGS